MIILDTTTHLKKIITYFSYYLYSLIAIIGTNMQIISKICYDYFNIGFYVSYHHAKFELLTQPV
jgi:hypothetical protein